MSNFFESRRISRNTHNGIQQQRQVIINSGNNSELEIVGPSKSSNGSAHVHYPSGEPRKTVGGYWKLVNVNTSGSVRATANGLSEGSMNSMIDANISTVNHDIDTAKTDSQRMADDENKAGLALCDQNLGFIERDMCASTTGVVRLQSRKKAEMFLGRTDGFSCARQKVTESSLAFTHPSTQQQMLMWKSTPKTILLLKKPGEQLMEEAKEVIIFLDSKKHPSHLNKMVPLAF